MQETTGKFTRAKKVHRRSYIVRQRTPYRGDKPGGKFELTMSGKKLAHDE